MTVHRDPTPIFTEMMGEQDKGSYIYHQYGYLMRASGFDLVVSAGRRLAIEAGVVVKKKPRRPAAKKAVVVRDVEPPKAIEP